MKTLLKTKQQQQQQNHWNNMLSLHLSLAQVYIHWVFVCVCSSFNTSMTCFLYMKPEKKTTKNHSRILCSQQIKKNERKEICYDTTINEILNSLTTFGLAVPCISFVLRFWQNKNERHKYTQYDVI